MYTQWMFCKGPLLFFHSFGNLQNCFILLQFRLQKYHTIFFLREFFCIKTFNLIFCCYIYASVASPQGGLWGFSPPIFWISISKNPKLAPDFRQKVCLAPQSIFSPPKTKFRVTPLLSDIGYLPSLDAFFVSKTWHGIKLDEKKKNFNSKQIFNNFSSHFQLVNLFHCCK